MGLKAIGITCGIGSMLVGARNAGFDVQGNVEWRKYYHYRDAQGRNTFEQNFPGKVFKKNLAEFTQSELANFTGADIALGHPESFRPDVPVFTSNGMIPIEMVNVGDLVLTHQGRFCRVYKSIQYKAPKKTHEVSLTMKDGTELIATSNHPVQMDDGTWKPIEKVQYNECVRSILYLNPIKFSSHKVVGIKSFPVEVGSPLCNLGVEEDESYIVKGFVVHNCGNFSNLSGANVGMGHDHRKEPMDIPLYCDLVARLRPRFFVMDDLPRSLDAFTMEQYHEKLPDYDLFPEWVSNWGYGNIQKNRNRMFMIGALRAERFVFRPGEVLNPRTLLDVIGDIPPGTPNHIKHTEGGHSPRARCAALPDKFWTWKEVADRFMEHPTGWSWTYRKPDGTEAIRIGFLRTHEKYSHVLTGQNSTCHPLTGYPFTLRERARIQGFPDEFVFYSEKVDDRGEWCHEENIVLIRQTGKAMPIQFCQYVSEQVKAHIEGRPFHSSGERVLRPHEHVNLAKQWYCKNVGYAANQEGACSACWKNRMCTARDTSIVAVPVKVTATEQLEIPLPPKKKDPVVKQPKSPRQYTPVEAKDLSFGGTDGD